MRKKSKRYVGRTGIRKASRPGKQPRPYWKKVHWSQNEIQWFHPATWRKIRQAAVVGATIIGVGVYGPKLMDLLLGSAISRFFIGGLSEMFSDFKKSFKL